MTSKTVLATLLGALTLTLMSAAVVRAQPSAGEPGYLGPDEPIPSNTDDRTLKIEARRERRLRNARAPGSPNRMNPMRTFPGELPEKTVTTSGFDLEGRLVEDASLPQALPTSTTHAAAPDGLQP
jgi:hypothetical protein